MFLQSYDIACFYSLGKLSRDPKLRFYQKMVSENGIRKWYQTCLGVTLDFWTGFLQRRSETVFYFFTCFKNYNIQVRGILFYLKKKKSFMSWSCVEATSMQLLRKVVANSRLDLASGLYRNIFNGWLLETY